MVIFYGRWLRNTETGVQQTHILVNDETEDKGKFLVSTVEGRRCVTRTADSTQEAMTLVANLCERMGGHD